MNTNRFKQDKRICGKEGKSRGKFPDGIMIWKQFEVDKKYLENQYSVDHWDVNSGMSLELLRDRCEKTALAPDKSRAVIRAELICGILENAQIEINPFDWFQDKINHGDMIARIENKWLEEALSESDEALKERREKLSESYACTGERDFGHCTPDWKRILQFGIPGLRHLAEEKRKNCSEGKQLEFYNCCIQVADSLICLLNRIADLAERVGEKYEKQKLVAKSLRNLAAGAPTDILEAMQLIILYYEMQTFVEGTLIRSLGNIDALLYRYYVNDLASGRYTEDQVRELLDYFMYKLMAKSVTANVPICIGAADENFGPNALSYIFLDEYSRLGIYDPKIHIRYNQYTSDAMLRRIFENIRKGHNSYVFLNDDAISASLESIGIDRSISRDYAIVGCYEPCVNGKEVPCSCNGRINLLKAVEFVLSNGVDVKTGEMTGLKTGELSEFSTFEDFYKAVKKQIEYLAISTMEFITDVEKKYPQIHTAPMHSMSFESCMENGTDAYEGGAEYNNSSVNAFGIANVVDSLEMIKHIVYENGEMTLKEFAEIVLHNWDGYENFRLRCKKDFPKYGNGNDEADRFATELTSYTASLINGKPNGRRGVFRFGAFSIDWRIYFGAGTWATPDGRLAGDPISKNIDAVAGEDKNGITSLMNSVTKLDFKHIPNGSVLDVTLHNTAVSGEDGMTAMFGLLKTFMKCGGMAIQFNVLDEKMLIDAQKHPENYKNLQVRLCGWNVYYVNLSKKEQDDFIKQLKESR